LSQKRVGNFSIKFENPPSVIGSATIAGTKEAEGRLASYFDQTLKDERFGEESWEKAESKMQKTVLQNAVAKSGLSLNNLDYIFAGDLLNQCTASHYGIRESSRPF
jgi:Stage V sporulation protein AD (SpoVAD).